MLTFTETSFIIEIECGSNPIENWQSTYEELIDAMQCEDSKMHTKNRYYYLDLLRQMMPDYELAKRMVAKTTEV